MSTEVDILLSNLTAAYTCFVQVSGQLEPSKREQAGVCGDWSPRQVIAHLAGWDRALYAFIHDPANFVPPGDIDIFNANSVAERDHLSWEKTLSGLQRGMEELRAVTSNVKPELRIYPRVHAWLQSRTTDYEVHARQLQAWVESAEA